MADIELRLRMPLENAKCHLCEGDLSQDEYIILTHRKCWKEMEEAHSSAVHAAACECCS